MRKRGSILVVVLFVMTVLSTIALSLAYRASLHVRKEQTQEVESRLRSYARSAIAVALTRLCKNANGYDHPAESWYAHPPFSMEEWLGEEGEIDIAYKVGYQVIDEEGKLNISVASSEALETLGMSEAKIAALLDWQDSDTIARSEGAESDYYLQNSPSYRCKNTSLERLGELLRIRHFGLNDYRGEDSNHNRILDPGENDGAFLYPPDNADGILTLGWGDLLTCYGDGRVNLNTAPPLVLKALPIREEAVEQILAFRFFDENSSGDIEDHAFRSVEDIDQLQGLSNNDRDILKAVGRFASEHFRIFAWAAHQHTGLRYELDVVVRINEEKPEILEWQTVR